jgi:hypothetical protein
MRGKKTHYLYYCHSSYLGVGSVWGAGLDVDIAHDILSPNLVWDVKLSDPVPPARVDAGVRN